MRVVSNTSPISNLAIIGRLDVLSRQFGTICIPESVRRELARLEHDAGSRAIEEALLKGWIQVEATTTGTLPAIWHRPSMLAKLRRSHWLHVALPIF